jgi:BCL2-associated athanogene 3
MSNFNAVFGLLLLQGFPFDSERKPRGSRLQKHLDELAARHPEFAQHLRPSEMAFANKSEQRRRQPSGSSSGVFSSGDEDAVSDTHSQVYYT